MTRLIGQASGVLFLLCGMALMTQAAARLRADPPLGGGGAPKPCDYETPGTGMKNCATSSPCEIANETQCYLNYVWEVKSVPLKCVSTESRVHCDQPDAHCVTYIECEYNAGAGKCQKKATQPKDPAKEVAPKLIEKACP